MWLEDAVKIAEPKRYRMYQKGNGVAIHRPIWSIITNFPSWMIIIAVLTQACGQDRHEAAMVSVEPNFGTVRGIVVGASSIRVGVNLTEGNVPIAGVQCSLGQNELNTTTDDDGLFVFEDVSPGSYVIACETAAADGTSYAFVRVVDVVRGQTADLLTVEISRTGSIIGKAVLADETDHSGIIVYLEPISRHVTTGSLGEYLLPNVPSGVYDLRFEKRGYPVVTRPGVVSPSGDLVIVGDVMLTRAVGLVGEIFIEDGRGYSTSRTVLVSITASTNAALVILSEDSKVDSGTLSPVRSSLLWTFGSDGEQRLYARFVDQDGFESSTVSDSIVVDTSPPTGSVTINHGSLMTLNPYVTLTIVASDTVTSVAEMKISNEPNLLDAVWEPFSDRRLWALPPIPGTTTVYAALKDLAGNEMPVAVSTSVVILPDQVTVTDAKMVATGYTPAVGDIDGDGLLEVLGTFNIGSGTLEPVSPEAIGLEAVFYWPDSRRIYRDNRLADLDNDGDLDLVVNGYASIEDNTIALLFWNDGTGHFTLDPAFTSHHIGGFGETILVFDFNNDGYLDVFLPHYSHNSPAEHSYLLRNLGNGMFVDVADEAGVALRGIPSDFKVEGAHAADVNDDGFIDFIVASHLFLNGGNGSFIDMWEVAGLPRRFDEGLSFLDWNVDGKLDIVSLHPWAGPEVYEQRDFVAINGMIVPTFEIVDVFPRDLPIAASYGLKVFDANADGLPDISLASGLGGESVLLLNFQTDFRRSLPPHLINDISTSSAAGDFDGDNRLDIVRRGDDGIIVQYNTTELDASRGIWIRLADEDGIKNQQGRVVRIWPLADPTFIMTQTVESGSGFMSQNQYELFFGTPFSGPHHVDVVFGDTTVQAQVDAGSRLEIRRNRTPQVY